MFLETDKFTLTQNSSDADLEKYILSNYEFFERKNTDKYCYKHTGSSRLSSDLSFKNEIRTLLYFAKDNKKLNLFNNLLPAIKDISLYVFKINSLYSKIFNILFDDKSDNFGTGLDSVKSKRFFAEQMSNFLHIQRSRIDRNLHHMWFSSNLIDDFKKDSINYELFKNYNFDTSFVSICDDFNNKKEVISDVFIYPNIKQEEVSMINYHSTGRTKTVFKFDLSYYDNIMGLMQFYSKKKFFNKYDDIIEMSSSIKEFIRVK